MAKNSGIGLISGGDLYTTTPTPGLGMQIGQLFADGTGGKYFRYNLNGAVASVVGNLMQDAAQDTQFENMAVLATTIGSAFINVTNGTTTVVPADYIGGSIFTYTAGTIAIGDEYTITGVSGVLTTGGALQVYLDAPLRASMTTSAKVVMKKSPWADTIQFPVTTQTGMPVGVTIFPEAIANYGFIQTHGVAAALSDNSTFAVGSMLSPSLAVAGAVGVNVAGTTHGTIGWARMAAASAHAISVFLMID